MDARGSYLLVFVAVLLSIALTTTFEIVFLFDYSPLAIAVNTLIGALIVATVPTAYLYRRDVLQHQPSG
jgi:hypothetical protein